MPKDVRTISCCYCGASTMLDLRKICRGILTCDACGAKLSSTKMKGVMQREVPLRKARPKPSPTGFKPIPRDKGAYQKPKKTKKKKRKGLLDRLEDIWDDIEDIFD